MKARDSRAHSTERIGGGVGIEWPWKVVDRIINCLWNTLSNYLIHIAENFMDVKKYLPML